MSKEIEQKERERKLLNNELVKNEADSKAQKMILTDLKQQKKEQTNKIQACEQEQKSLGKRVSNLSKEKERYGQEASQANAKYYECLEQVKVKNNLIQKLQKKHIEQEARLKT